MQKEMKVPAGAIEINGRHYLRNATGDMVAIENIKPADLLIDEMVNKQVDYARDMNAEMTRFQTHCYGEIGAMDALLDQHYGVKRPEKSKGNRTFNSFNGRKKVSIKVTDQMVFGPELQCAKKLLDEIIQEKSAGADPFLMTLVNQAFSVDKEGKVNRASIIALSNLDVPDPRWPQIQRAIADASRVIGTKSYLNFYARTSDEGKPLLVPLDMAAIVPTPDAFARPSLRRRVEAGRQSVAVALDELMYGDVLSAASVLAQLVRDLEGEVSADIDEWLGNGCANYAVKAEAEDEVVS